MKTIHEKMVYWRRVKNVKVEDIAKKMKMTIQNYYKIERGEIELKYSNLEQFAKAVGAPIVQIIDEDRPKSEWQQIMAEKDKQIMDLQQKLIDLLSAKK